MLGGCAISTVYNLYEIAHEGHEEGTPKEVPYMHNRAKPFPWKCSDCELFNDRCWKGEDGGHGEH